MSDPCQRGRRGGQQAAAGAPFAVQPRAAACQSAPARLVLLDKTHGCVGSRQGHRRRHGHTAGRERLPATLLLNGWRKPQGFRHLPNPDRRAARVQDPVSAIITVSTRHETTRDRRSARDGHSRARPRRASTAAAKSLYGRAGRGVGAGRGALRSSTMTQVWIGVLIAGAAGMAGLLVKRLLLGSGRGTPIDVGPVSEGWLSEQRAGKREDGYSS